MDKIWSSLFEKNMKKEHLNVPEVRTKIVVSYHVDNRKVLTINTQYKNENITFTLIYDLKT